MSSAKLSRDEYEGVGELQSINMKPRQILKQLKTENENNVCNIRHINNALQKHKRELMGELTAMQYFFKQLKD